MYNKTFIGDYVNLYGISIAVGILLCIFVLRYLGKKQKVDSKFLDFVETLGYAVILIGFFSAALFQAVYDWIETGTFRLFDSGLTFIGGLIGGAGSFILIYYFMRKKLTGKIIDILPIAPACIAIAHAFGRLGCFFAGCCGGKLAQEGDLFYFLAMNFPESSQLSGLRYPTQLFECIFLLILFAVIFFLVIKKNFKYGFVVYLASYGVWRFFIEILRDDSRGSFVPGLTPSQFWSIIMVIGAIPVYFLLRYLLKTRKNNDENKLNEGNLVDENK